MDNFMNKKIESSAPSVSGFRPGERGAALLTVLLGSMLLFATSGALILTTALTTRTAVDSSSELQAYYIAAAGLDKSLSVLRGQIAPNGALPGAATINYRD